MALPEGYKLLIPDPVSLIAFSVMDRQTRQTLAADQDQVREQQVATIVREYGEIFSLVQSIVSPSNVLVLETVLLTMRPSGSLQVHHGPKLDRFPTVKAPFLRLDGSDWPRDAFTVINGKVHANVRHWLRPTPDCPHSPLGDGGTIFHRGRVLLTSPTAWQKSKTQVEQLKAEGIKAGWIPSVDPTKQRWDFPNRVDPPAKDHIDGHSNLVLPTSGKPVLVAAKSYVNQGRYREAANTKVVLQDTLKRVGAELVVVNDRHLPPLAFNFEQFADGTIAMTSEASDLQAILEQLVGKDKVRTTAAPLVLIPELATGSLRCLINFLPPHLLPGANPELWRVTLDSIMKYEL